MRKTHNRDLTYGAAPIAAPPKSPGSAPRSAPPTRTVAGDLPRPPNDPSKLIPLPPSFKPVLDFYGPADPNLLGPWAVPKGVAKAHAVPELKFKEPKPRDQDKTDLLVPAWKSQQPKPPTGDPVSLGPNPKGQVADIPKAKFKAPPLLMEEPMISEVLDSGVPLDFQRIGEAVIILGIDADFDFEGCTGSLGIAAEQRQILEKILPQATAFPQIANSAARSIISVLDVAKLKVPSSSEGPLELRVDALARLEILREMAETLVQARSVVRISEEAMASAVAAKGLPEAEHHVPPDLQDRRQKSLPKVTPAEALAKAAALKAAAERAGLSGADVFGDSRQLAKKQKTTESSSSGTKSARS